MAPGLPEMDYVKRAKLVIDDIVLRDLVLHQKYGGACPPRTSELRR